MYLKSSIQTSSIDYIKENIHITLTLYDPGGGFKSPPPPPPIFCSHAFNFGAALLCVGDFSQKIV